MKKLLMYLMIGIFMISFATSLEFDNVKYERTTTFDGKLIEGNELLEKYKPIEIKNSFGLGSKLFEGYLSQHDEVCGIDCLSTMEIKLHNKEVLIQDVITKTLQEDGSWIEQPIRRLDIEYFGTIDDYETQCSVVGQSKNGTDIQECNSVKVGSHEGWIRYNIGTEVDAGIYKVKLLGQKKPSRTVDWIIKTQGKELESWATWGSIGGGDDAEVILNSPADASTTFVFNNLFNASLNVTGGATLVNASLCTNETGTWGCYNFTFLTSIPINDSHDNSQSTGGPHSDSLGGMITIRDSNLELINVTTHASSTPTRAFLLWENGTQIASTTTLSGKTFTFGSSITLLSNTAYRFEFDGQGGTVNAQWGTFSDVGDTNLFWTIGSNNGANHSNFYDLLSIQYSKPLTNSTQTWNRTISDGIIWNVQACDSDGDCGFSTSNYSLTLDPDAPTIVVENPTALIDYGAVGENETLNVTFTDTNLDSCWYNYNGTNITIEGCVSGIKNSTNFILESGNTNMTIYSNDTISNLNTTFISWEYQVFTQAETYLTTATETSVQNFIINITVNSSKWNSITAKLNYAGVNYTGTQTGIGDDLSYTAEIDIDAITEEVNNSFHWIFSLTNATGVTIVQSTPHNQTVSEITFGICDPTDLPYINFTTYSATNPFPLVNATFKSSWDIRDASGGAVILNRSYEDVTETNSSFAFCISPNNTNYTVNIDVEIDGTGYAQNYHYINNATLVNTTSNNISLYLLNDSLATLTELEVVDGSQAALEDVLISIQFYDVGTDTFYTVGMAKTSYAGKDLAYLNWYDSFYKFVFVKDGSTILTTTPYKISETPQIFEVITDTVFEFDKFEDFEYSLYFNESTNNFVLTFVKPSGDVDQGCLRVIKRNQTNDYTICETCESSSSATVYCNIAGEGNGTFIGTFYATGSFKFIDTELWTIGVNEVYDLIGNEDGTIMAIILSGIVVSFFFFSPVMGVVGAVVGLLASLSLGFITVDITVFTGIVILGMVVIWLIKK